MAWHFKATGHKEQCLAELEASTPPEDPAAANQYERMRAVLKAELALYADGATGMSVAASGQAPSEDGGDRTFSIWISGKVAPHAKPAPTAESAKATPQTKGETAQGERRAKP